VGVGVGEGVVVGVGVDVAVGLGVIVGVRVGVDVGGMAVGMGSAVGCGLLQAASRTDPRINRHAIGNGTPLLVTVFSGFRIVNTCNKPLLFPGAFLQ
jgi:hypothetical protein